MIIKKVNGEEVHIQLYKKYIKTWADWEDIKPIIDEYQSRVKELEEYMETIENEHVGCSDYSLMIKDS